jgi:hypothetical protein
LTKQKECDIILTESEVREMRKLNYDIKVGTRFELPKTSWQVAEVAGKYEITERKVHEWQGGDVEVEYICINLDRPLQNPVRIAEMTMAYLLGEDVDGEAGKVYEGVWYQPTGTDDFRVATEDEGVEVSEPFWYLGHFGNGDYGIDVDFNRGKWCFFTLPWD